MRKHKTANILKGIVMFEWIIYQLTWLRLLVCCVISIAILSVLAALCFLTKLVLWKAAGKVTCYLVIAGDKVAGWAKSEMNYLVRNYLDGK